jgi:ferredoxin-type protein NapG
MIDQDGDPKNRARRSFLRAVSRMAGSVGVFGFLLGAYGKRSAALPATAIRPPGAIAEKDFLGACVRCGLCVRACPYDTLTLAKFGEPLPTGTPYFIARDIPCEMCEDIPCLEACPTGALDPALREIKEADMGLAVFVGIGSCYAIWGTSCRACYIACPVKDQAINMKMLFRDRKTVFMPTVTAEHCTGCGKCEEACLTPEASIKVLPRALLENDTGYDVRRA